MHTYTHNHFFVFVFYYTILYANCQVCSPSSFVQQELNICYYFSTDGRVVQAAATCPNSYSQLPKFQNQAEVDDFAKLVTRLNKDTTDFWLGLKRPSSTVAGDQYKWIIDSSQAYNSARGAWGANYNSIPQTTGYCAIVTNYTWSVAHCQQSSHYVVCQCRNCSIPTTVTTSTSTTTTRKSTTTTSTSASSTSTTTILATTPSTTATTPTTLPQSTTTTTTVPTTTSTVVTNAVASTTATSSTTEARSSTSSPDCGTVKWSAWSSCSVTCGNGTKSQFLLTNTFCSPSVNVASCYSSCPQRKHVMEHDPLSKSERTFATIAQSLGCIVLIVFLCLTLVLFFILRIFSLERMLHMCQEISLLIAHVAINLSMKSNISIEIGTAFAVILQYFFLVNFTFLTLEALQTYCTLKHVVNSGGYFNWKVNFFIGWLTPVPIVAVTAAAYPDDFTSEYSFWLNFGSNIAFFTIIPLLIFFCLIVIMTEAAAMGETNQWPLTIREKYTAAMLSQKGAIFIVASNYLSWSFGAFALYWQKIALYGTVFAFNCALGVSIFVFHTLGNEKVVMYLRRKLCREQVIKQTAAIRGTNSEKTDFGKNKVSQINESMNKIGGQHSSDGMPFKTFKAWGLLKKK